MNIRRSVSLRGGKVKAALPSAAALLAWYDHHQRILPWRARPGMVPNPYHVWLSEIMLQQTTVATVGPYFQKFIKRWPTLRHLAKAPIDEVMQMWAGLGYYRRARFLHECARTVYADFDGRFPETESELRKLPGFGPYTTAAVTAIAFNQRANVVDGNVERVVARVFAIRTAMPAAKTELRDAASRLLPNERYGDYAQALMDLGATICTPRHPKCDLCPWAGKCQAHAKGIEDQLPARVKAKAKPVRRAVAFVLLNKKGEIYLRKRPVKGLLGGMMEIPSSAWAEGPMPDLASVKAEAPLAACWVLKPGLMVKHTFSHFELELAVAMATTTKGLKGRWVRAEALKDEALPSVMLKIARQALGTV